MTEIPDYTGQLAVVGVVAVVLAVALWNAISPKHQPPLQAFRTAVRVTTDFVGQLTVAATFVLFVVWCVGLGIAEAGVWGLMWRSLVASAASSVVVVPLALCRRWLWRRQNPPQDANPGL